MPNSAPTPPEKLPAPVNVAEVDLRALPGQRQELNVQAGLGGVAVKRQDTWIETGYAWVSLILAAVVLLVGLARYPVQVTPDEVYPSLQAVELIENGFKGADGALLPAFLPGSTPFGIGSNAYLQVLPQLLRPDTLIWIRGCNAVLALLAGLLLAYYMRIGLKSQVCLAAAAAAGGHSGLVHVCPQRAGYRSRSQSVDRSPGQLRLVPPRARSLDLCRGWTGLAELLRSLGSPAGGAGGSGAGGWVRLALPWSRCRVLVLGSGFGGVDVSTVGHLPVATP